MPQIDLFDDSDDFDDGCSFAGTNEDLVQLMKEFDDEELILEVLRELILRAAPVLDDDEDFVD